MPHWAGRSIRFGRACKAEQDLVGVDIQGEADREDGQPSQKPQISRPLGAIFAELRDDTRIDVRVDHN